MHFTIHTKQQRLWRRFYECVTAANSFSPCNDLVCVHPARRSKKPSKTEIADFQYTLAVN